ncbi:tyrosine-type recombinase/integrase [Vibrio parahaemolyticus]|uniref:tyrosine-type recombinase/integrase n=2 Tax=Vibrio parahaemolyticus TaxID=670 RepID=UPI001F0BB72C|nr:site-specific integrase [Vibrio parahaemolyticus]MDF4760720.1 tyrosine-type recombinase/integrase [Vibrio parahaemolyticus]MDF5207591.1 tyrosine-type recombinase/integrase [Vibrio parahaemolyticus]MDF5217513.1 tyrosine-type recombinase/integrase [Vibrio parahaemolyticus]
MSKRLIDMNKKVLSALPRPAKGEQGVEYPWKKNPRLRVLVTAKSMRWIVRLGWKGKRYYESFGTCPEMKFADFEKLAYQFIADVQSGAYRKGSRLTVQQFFDEVLVPFSQRHHRDHKTFVSRSKRVMAVLGNKRIADVTRRDVEKFLHSLTGLSPATVNRYQAFLSKLFSMAVEHDIIEKSPVKGVKKLAENNVKDRVLSSKEVESFCRHACAEPNFIHAYALMLSLLTGMRIGNVISLSRSMLADDLSSALLPMTKSGKSQHIYFSEPAKRLIRKCLKVSFNDWVFPSLKSQGEHIAYPRACMERIQQAMKQEGCLDAPFTIHDLRRTYATQMLLATNDIRLAQQSLGHSNVNVTERYAYYQNTHLAQACQQTVDAMLPNFQFS